jgi:hypothetical protein
MFKVLKYTLKKSRSRCYSILIPGIFQKQMYFCQTGNFGKVIGILQHSKYYK